MDGRFLIFVIRDDDTDYLIMDDCKTACQRDFRALRYWKRMNAGLS